MKSNTPQHHKFLRLKRRFKLTLWQTVGILESLWLLTCTNAPDGAIGKLSNEDIAAGIDWQDDADSLITTLIECGWLDQCPKNRLVVHDWADHCPNYIRGGLAKKSKSFARVESDEVEPKVVPKVEPKVVPRVQPKDQPKDEPLCLDPSSLVYSGQVNPIQYPPLTPPKGEVSEHDPAISQLPKELDTPAFRSAWIDWFEYRKERKLPKPKPKTIEAKLNEMIGWGADASVEQIRISIANGWQGIFEPKKKPGTPARKGGFASDTLTDILGPPSPDGQLPTLGIFDRITAEQKAENQQRLLEIRRMRGEANGR